MSLKMIKISVCQRQFSYVLNSVLLSGNRDASLNWFLFNYSLQHHQPFAYMYIHSLLQCHHLEENMWLITSVKIYSQINISLNEPSSLLFWIIYTFLQCLSHSRQPGAEQQTTVWLSLFLLFMFLFKSSTFLWSCSILVYHGLQV